MEAAAKLSDRYISDRFLPDKEIDLIVHISIQLGISQAYGRYLDQIKQEFKYAKILNTKYIVIHTETKGK